MDFGDCKIFWLGHSGFRIECSSVIYIDPYNISSGQPLADIILLTHGHNDHCSVTDLKKIIRPGTRIFLTPDCQSKILNLDVPTKIEIVSPGQEYDLNGLRILTVPSYNLDKNFHPKEQNWVGYVLKTKETIIYHSGDSDLIPEMQKLTGHKQKEKIFVCLLPIGGRFTMGPEEAINLCKLLKSDYAIPMHYGSISGTLESPDEFIELCREEGINSVLLKKE